MDERISQASRNALDDLEAVLFDLDGVLVDSYQVWFHLMNAAARDLGYAAISAEDFHGCWGQGMEADQERFFPRHGIPEIEAYYEAHFGEHLEHIAVMPQVPELFGRLRALGLPSAVVTNSPLQVAQLCLARAGATPDTVVGGSCVERTKPAPDMLLEACRRLRVAAERALVVGDSRYDRDAARSAGSRFAGVGMPGDLQVAAVAELLGHLPQA